MNVPKPTRNEKARVRAMLDEWKPVPGEDPVRSLMQHFARSVARMVAAKAVRSVLDKLPELQKWKRRRRKRGRRHKRRRT